MIYHCMQTSPTESGDFRGVQDGAVRRLVSDVINGSASRPLRIVDALAIDGGRAHYVAIEFEDAVAAESGDDWLARQDIVYRPVSEAEFNAVAGE